MGSKNSAPPPPDYTPIAQASEASAKYSFDLGKEQLAWAKQQYADNKEVTDKVVNAALERQQTNDTNAAKDRARYESTFQPLEDSLAKDAQDYNSPERQALNMGRAQATVAENFENSRRAAAQNLESFGVDPSSTRYAALDAGSRIAEAAAKAAAGNQAQQQTEAMGQTLRSEAINIGRGYPGQVAGAYGTALQSGNQGVNSGLATTASGATTMGTAPQWQATGNSALSGWGNTLNMGYQNAMSQYEANQKSSSGLGSLLGAGLGALTLFADGGAVPDEATPGGAVPAHASPTRGKAIDDVDAKLTAGEFVVPKDTVQWLGEKHFQDLINKSRKDRSQATAQPRAALAPRGVPTFASRPASAIPAAA